MSVLCRLWDHAAVGKGKWNAGYFFSRCSRCGSDILRTANGSWKKPPKHHRVIWKPIGPNDIDWEAWERRMSSAHRPYNSSGLPERATFMSAS